MDFNEHAKTWDTDKRIERAKIISKEIAAKVNRKNGLTAMEFGCGTGLVSFNLEEMFDEIMLVDSSEGMLEIVNEKIEKLNVNNFSARLVDLTVNDLTGVTFDVIYTSMVLHHIKELKMVLKKLYSLLNQNGQLIVVDLNSNVGFHNDEAGFEGHNGFEQKEFFSLLKGIGFRQIQSETFYHGQKENTDKSVNYSLFITNAIK